MPACNYDGDTDLKAWGIKSYKDMWKHGLGKFNPLYESLNIPMDDNWAPDPSQPLTTERYKMRDGSYWDQTTDNFEQSHNILNFTWQPTDRWSHSVTAHYTYGYERLTTHTAMDTITSSSRTQSWLLSLASTRCT